MLPVCKVDFWCPFSLYPTDTLCAIIPFVQKDTSFLHPETFRPNFKNNILPTYFSFSHGACNVSQGSLLFLVGNNSGAFSTFVMALWL